MPAFFRPLSELAAILALIAAGVVAWHQYWYLHPEHAFEFVTGRPLPAGLHATAYNWDINDNLLHVGHYWMLAGSAAQLRQFPSSMAVGDSPEKSVYTLRESTEDARHALPDTTALFGRRKTEDQVVIGYENNAPRNSWYWIFDGETEALYEHN
ncbi:hypothetical protein LC55x_1155 [Lysobacter capsici]|uniref:hypothetical protein n=1 Tax=Lysobacter capsici TaxID=435897 RepID=UPI00072116B5|nr:hypothetical protein [Lysobacter capsici]ALN84446.1 hypothetical protein LC55x_1155 [Lysobacter capsici]